MGQKKTIIFCFFDKKHFFSFFLLILSWSLLLLFSLILIFKFTCLRRKLQDESWAEKKEGIYHFFNLIMDGKHGGIIRLIWGHVMFPHLVYCVECLECHNFLSIHFLCFFSTFNGSLKELVTTVHYSLQDIQVPYAIN